MCKEVGCKFISGLLSAKCIVLNSCQNNRGVRLAILPVKDYSKFGNKLVYCLLDMAQRSA